MAKDPAVLFYTADFLSTIQGLTLDEIGALIKLLCIQHQTGHLSEKTIKIAVGSISQDVLAFFKKDENGHLYNERMENEAKRRKAFTESRRKNAEKAKGAKKSICKANASHMETETETVTVNKTETEAKSKSKYGFFNNVLLSSEELKKLKEKYPQTYEKQIENLSYYIESKGDKYKSHYATILSWARRDKGEESPMSSFDTDEFFQAALARSEKRIKERSKINTG